MGKGFPIKGQQKPKVPVEEEGKWERQRVLPRSQKPGVRLTSTGSALGVGGRFTHRRPSRAQSSPHIHRQSLPHPLRHPGGPHIQLRTQEMEFKRMRREEGGRSGKAQEKATTESLSWERGRRNPPEGR